MNEKPKKRKRKRSLRDKLMDKWAWEYAGLLLDDLKFEALVRDEALILEQKRQKGKDYTV